MSRSSCHMTVARRSTAGFSLIEMMVAMALGVLVLGAAIAVFQTNQRTYLANEGLGRIQESARVAYEMMTRDIRSAGSSACSNEALVMGTDDVSLQFRAPITGSATELTVTSADDLSYRVESATSNSVTLTEDSPAATDIFEEDDIVMVCNAAMTGFVEVASVAGKQITFKTSLEFDPSDTSHAAEGSISIARMRSTRWFVGTNSRGGSSLFVSRFDGDDEEVAEGVESVAFTYHQASGGNPDVYVAAPSDWNYVDVVRVVMELQGEDIDGRSLERTASTAVSIRSRTL